jgi:hypothetical protein
MISVICLNVMYLMCTEEKHSWATNTGPFLQNLNETLTSTFSKARFLHCTRGLKKKMSTRTQNKYMMAALGIIQSKVYSSYTSQKG